ncbi:MAG: retropepsin-like aspartic protease family protein [Planktomarina sp.]
MGDTIASMIYLGVILIALCSIFFAANRPSIGQTLQMLLIWGMIFMGLIAGYGLWGDISGQFSNGRTAQFSSEGDITVPRSRDGHFYLTLTINDTPVEFLIDTGASDLVLTRDDAERVGIDPDDLIFSGRAFTANGEVAIARARLDTVVLGSIEDRRVLASVNGGAMNGSLLGMSYLGRFEKLEINANKLILHR